MPAAVGVPPAAETKVSTVKTASAVATSADQRRPVSARCGAFPI